MDVISETRLKLVVPELAQRIRNMSDAGISFRVTRGLATWAEQNKIWQQGRTTPGKIVTNAPAGYSWHNFGMAVDVVPMDPLPDWNLSHPVWKAIVAAGKALGLYSGTQFTHKDTPHFQLTGRFPVSPDDEVRRIFRDVGMKELWLEACLTK